MYYIHYLYIAYTFDSHQNNFSFSIQVETKVLAPEERGEMKQEARRFLAVTKPELFTYKTLTDAVPHFIHQVNLRDLVQFIHVYDLCMTLKTLTDAVGEFSLSTWSH